MKKHIIYIIIAMVCLISKATAQNGPPLLISGTVTDSKGIVLSNATIKIKESKLKTLTNEEGYFSLSTEQRAGILIISFLGYTSAEISFDKSNPGPFQILLKEDENSLKEVEVVSTGYQNIPKERVTGSFTHISNETISRNVGVNILDRLEGLTSGLLLNRGLPTNGISQPKISVHGRSTLFANAEPLIVLDGFAYDGTIDQINASDIETIDILKDAAASSIWGTRASNGVIVLTTKKGKRNKKLSIEISSTFTITDKPNLYYRPQISSSDYIYLEQYLFSKGFYNGKLNNSYSVVSPAVEIFNDGKNNQISTADSAKFMNEMKSHDVRKDLGHYAYRSSVYQQHQLNISGGGENNRYYMSGGYDKNLENSVADSYDRLTLNAINTYLLLKDKLEINGGINFTSSNTYSKSNPYSPYTPYDRLADNNGNSLPVVGNSTLRASYTDTVGNGKLLDWRYRPKDEMVQNSIFNKIQYKINLGLNYKVFDGLNLSANYQYLKENNDREIHNDQNTYYTRNLINQYSSIVGNDLIRGVPMGGVLNNSEMDLISKTGRIQLNYQKKILNDHEINMIVGYEGNDNRSNNTSLTLYGYNPETQINGNNLIDPQNYYPYYYEPQLNGQISTAPDQHSYTSISQSYYTNISYSYKNKYTLSGSARKDESNLFGVKSNQKGVPLWSAGFAWNIGKETFYNIEWLPSLKLRATYGYNGNVDKTVSGYLTVRNIGLINEWGSNYSQIANPPNPTLRWEKVKTWNIGIDFSLKNNRVNGSLDIYQKSATDLIGNNPIAMQSGVTQFRGNGANLQSNGIDLVINSRNLVGAFQWATTFLLNYNTDKVTSYKIKQTSNGSIITGNFNNPLEGYPYYAIFSFPSAGLDQTGTPQGYLNGVVSKDYPGISSLLDPSQLKFHGSASPKYFGSLINTFSYKNLELSFNITYKLSYYFRRAGVFNGFSSDYSSTTDFDKRWQKPGDELLTKIPALTYSPNSPRGTFFQNSEDLVEKGDHIRLQDIRFSYRLFEKSRVTSVFKRASVFIYAKNLGIIWRKNHTNIDPDYGSYTIPQPISCSLGINFNL